MGKNAKGVNKIHFTMLYGYYCYIFIENFGKMVSWKQGPRKNDSREKIPRKMILGKMIASTTLPAEREKLTENV